MSVSCRRDANRAFPTKQVGFSYLRISCRFAHSSIRAEVVQQLLLIVEDRFAVAALVVRHGTYPSFIWMDGHQPGASPSKVDGWSKSTNHAFRIERVKVCSSWSVASNALPVISTQDGMSDLAPESVALTNTTWPGDRFFMAFAASITGIGQVWPVASTTTSGFNGCHLFPALTRPLPKVDS